MRGPAAKAVKPSTMPGIMSHELGKSMCPVIPVATDVFERIDSCLSWMALGIWSSHFFGWCSVVDTSHDSTLR